MTTPQSDIKLAWREAGGTRTRGDARDRPFRGKRTLQPTKDAHKTRFPKLLRLLRRRREEERGRHLGKRAVSRALYKTSCGVGRFCIQYRGRMRSCEVAGNCVQVAEIKN